ncbi:MAG: TetR/AcrR family transcriptional regulator [Microthrixaceae bacterium]
MSTVADRRPVRGRRLSPEDRKAEILDAAMAIAGEAGDLDAATLERVALAAGCSRNLVYRYFSHHDGLVDAMAERLRHNLEDAFTAIPDDLSTRERLDAVVDVLLDQTRRHGTLMLLLFDRPGGQYGRARRELLIGLLAQRLRSEGMPAARARVAAPILGGALIGAVSASIDGASRSAVTAEVRRLLDAFVG